MRGCSAIAKGISMWGSMTLPKKVAFLLSALLIAGLTTAGAQQLKTRPQYQIQPGDVMEVHYRYTPEYDQTVTVQPDGYITLNLVGNVKVSQATVEEARTAIIKQASERLNQPEVSITLKDFQKPYFVVAGQVVTPGKFDMRENTTALQAVMMAGGFKDTAKSSKIVLFRKINSDTAEVKVLDLKKMENTSSLERDIALQNGDMLLVPQNAAAKFERFMKLTNIGAYFDLGRVIP
jgi:polysaccharide export outer membrane protein